MVINKHGSFYLRNGWGTKIIEAVEENRTIFSPNNEQEAIDAIGLGRIMIKALRYWAVALRLCVEVKSPRGIEEVPTKEFDIINKYDKYFQKKGTLLIMHRNLANNIEESTAWYWFFNEWKSQTISKDDFIDFFHAYLMVNGVEVNRNGVEKEYNCLKNTYITEKSVNIKTITDEDTIPFLSPLKLIVIDKNKALRKGRISMKDLTTELLVYCIAKDNINESTTKGQVTVDSIVEGKDQVGRYFNMDYTSVIEGLLDAENKGYIKLNNNFGNRHIEFVDMQYDNLLEQYYIERER